jgi:GT2 family glycosyltransferase
MREKRTVEPDGEVVHVQGSVAARRPYRMMLEHHRSAWTFARRRLTGIQVLLLPFAAIYLSLRASLAIASYAWRARGPVGGGR